MPVTDQVERDRQTVRTVAHAALRAIYHSVRGGSLLHAQAVAYNMFLAFFPALVFLAGVLIYAAPGLAAPPLALLSPGALVVFHGEDGEFIEVLTADDRRGFILRSTPLEDVEI